MRVTRRPTHHNSHIHNTTRHKMNVVTESLSAKLPPLVDALDRLEAAMTPVIEYLSHEDAVPVLYTKLLLTVLATFIIVGTDANAGLYWYSVIMSNMTAAMLFAYAWMLPATDLPLHSAMLAIASCVLWWINVKKNER